MRLSSVNGGSGRIYDFYRGEGSDPNFVISDDNGQSWTYVGYLLFNPGDTDSSALVLNTSPTTLI